MSRNIPEGRRRQLHVGGSVKSHMFVTSEKCNVACRAVFGLTRGRRQRLLDSSCIFVYSSVRLSAWKSSASTERVFIKLGISVFFENTSRKSKFHYNRTRKRDTSHEDKYTFFILSRSLLLRMRNVSDERCRENQNTHFMYYNVFFFFPKIVPFMK